MKALYVYGASGHGLVVADIASSCGYTDVIFVDDGDNFYPTFEDIKHDISIPIAFGIGSNSIRAKLFKKVNDCSFKIVSLIHPSAIISSNVSIGKGTIVMPNVVVNSMSQIGEGVILNSSCVIEHECFLKDFVHISPNVAIAGNVKVDQFSHIGIGTSIIQEIKIGRNCIIGSGSVVVKNINDFKKAYGNPCREIEDINE